MFPSILNANEKIVIWTIVLSLSTILLGIVAVFQDIIRRIITKPILDCELILDSPHCHLLKKTYTYYIRFKVSNTGNEVAKNVEVFLQSVKNSLGEVIPVSPGNLQWSSLILKGDRFEPRMYWDYLSQGTHQYCNLGEITNPLHIPKEDMSFIPLEERKYCTLNLSLYWRSIDRSFQLPRGKYILEIVVGSSNAKPKNINFEIEHLGEWYDKEFEMFSKGLKIIRL